MSGEPNIPEYHPGDQFEGRFVLRKLLGKGNFSSVWAASQKVCGIEFREVALKMFNQRITAENARQVLNDLIIITGLAANSPGADVERHIVRVFDGGQSQDGQVYLVMEVGGLGRLDRKIAHHKGMPGIAGIPLEMSLSYLRQILKALAWMHTLPTPRAHGDLHPGNILLSDSGQIKIADFGLAVALPGPLAGGAVAYQAPENLLGQPGDTYSDVFSIGMIWHEMLAGQSPFHSDVAERLSLELNALQEDVKAAKTESDKKLLEGRLHAKQRELVQEHLRLRKLPLKRASEVNNTVKPYPQLEQILDRCLRFKPDERYFNAADVLKEIESFLSGQAAKSGPVVVVDAPAESAPTMLPEQSPAVMLQGGRALLERRDFAGAWAMAQKVLQTDPRSIHAQLLKANIRRLESDSIPERKAKLLEEALVEVKKAQALAPTNPDVLDELVRILKSQGRRELALPIEQRAMQLRASVRK